MFDLAASAMVVWFAGSCGCPPGEEPSDDGECTQCDAGYSKAAAGDGSCSACPPGSANPNRGSSSCEECRVGYFQRLEGQAECDRCPTGLSSFKGSPECDVCAEAFYRSEDASGVLPVASPQTCVACIPGVALPIGWHV